MKLVMTLLVRDEADVIDANIRYHLAAGVDLIIVTDNASEDGTTEILERYEREGALQLIREPSQDYRQAAWRTRMARMAATEHAADWVFNSDADEFWWPRQGTLKDAFATVPDRYGALALPLVDFVPRPDSDEPFYDRMLLAETEFTNRRGQPGRTKPKMAHRGSAEVEVSSGNHQLLAGDLPVVPGWQPILVFHFPMRSYGQFERKVTLKATNPTHDLDKQRADLVRLHRDGGLRRHYESRLLRESEVRVRLADGRLCEDSRLQRFMRRLDEGPQRAENGHLPEDAPELGLQLEMWRSVNERLRAEDLERRLRAKRERSATERAERALRRREKRQEVALARLSRIEKSRWWRLGRLPRGLVRRLGRSRRDSRLPP